jgi:hypothetical protein
MKGPLSLKATKPIAKAIKKQKNKTPDRGSCSSL